MPYNPRLHGPDQYPPAFDNQRLRELGEEYLRREGKLDLKDVGLETFLEEAVALLIETLHDDLTIRQRVRLFLADLPSRRALFLPPLP